MLHVCEQVHCDVCVVRWRSKLMKKPLVMLPQSRRDHAMRNPALRNRPVAVDAIGKPIASFNYECDANGWSEEARAQ